MADKGGEPPVATSAVLYAVARELSRVCGRVNAEFLSCKAGDDNPAACLAEVGSGGAWTVWPSEGEGWDAAQGGGGEWEY